MHPWSPRRRRLRARRLVRPAWVLVVGLLVATALPLGAAGAARAAGAAPSAPRAAAESDEPLQVVLTSMSPSVVPRSGVLTLSGSVSNTSGETWRDVNVSTTASTAPITSEADLRRANATRADSYVGDRLYTSHAFTAIGDLEPGQRATFTLRIPRDELPFPRGTPGVYWIGVHALGTNAAGRDGSADGRARTFIPQLAAGTSRVPLSVVLPLRAQVRRDPDLALTRPRTWAGLIGDDGRLGRLLALAGTAGAGRVDLLVDPAVPEAVETLRDGNRTDPTPTPSTSASPSPSAAADGDSGDSDDGDARGAGSESGDGSATARRAQAWLSSLRSLAERQRTFGLGYADPDVAALAGRRPAYLARSTQLSTQVFRRLGITARPAVAPVDGVLPTAAFSALDPATTVLLDDRAAPGTRATRVTSPAGQPVVIADQDAAAGGPEPGPTTSAFAVRQRILAEAAVRSVTRDTRPLVVVLPASWDPGRRWSSANFFGGLDRPWIQAGALDGTGSGPTASGLTYPSSAARARLGSTQLDAADDLNRSVRTYAGTLARPGDTATLMSRLTLGAVSVHERDDSSGPARARREAAGVRKLLDGIRVELGNDLVTMSGGSGTFTVTLVNELDHAVRVGVRVTSAPDLRIRASPRISVLPAGKRATVRLKANADATGVRVVGLRPTNASGAAVGTPVTFSVRSSQVSSLVWGVMGAAFALLVITIVRRAVRRGLRRRDA